MLIPKVFDHGDEVGLGSYWLNHARRAEFDGMVFSPGLDQPGYLNLWTGWGAEPKAGSCDKYLEFVQEVICSGDVDLFSYIIYWCAHLVQRPQELPETALVFRGREGIGKNTFVDALQAIVGNEHFLALTSMNQITGRFSGHLANSLLVFCNESVWGGDKSAQGVLKSMITDKFQPIEFKGRDLVMVQSFRRMIFATNEAWAVPRGEDDRRYVITDVSDARKDDYAYFKAIRDEMSNGGVEALMDYLLNRDISHWHPRSIPAHLQICGWELKIRSGGSLVQWWFDMLQRGWLKKIDSHYADEDTHVWPEKILIEDLQQVYFTWCLPHKIAFPEHSTVLGKKLHEWGVITRRPRTDNPGRKLFNVDLANKKITIGNNTANTFGYTGTWKGTEYIDILSGAITTYEYRVSTSSYMPSKSLRVIDVGVATNNTQVILPSYYSGQPQIMISPNNLQCYNSANSGQNQSLNIAQPVAVESSPGSGSWSFIPVAQLILSTGISSTISPADTKTSTSDAAINSTQFTTAANTTQINCILNLTSTKGTGTAPTWNARQVSARIRYGTVSGTYTAASSTVVFKLTANSLSNSVTLSTGTLTAGTYYFIVEYVSANSAVAPTTWTDGGAQYLYFADQTVH